MGMATATGMAITSFYRTKSTFLGKTGRKMGERIMNNRGFSIIEGVIAAGVVAASILAIGTMVGSHTNLAKRTETKQELPGLGTDVLNRARSVMVDIADPAGVRNQ